MSRKTIKNNYLKTFYKNLPLILILIAGVIIRILFYKSIDGPIQISDSETYIGGAKNMLKYLCLDEYRPPVYLIQLLILGVIFTWDNLEIVAIVVQSIIGLFSVIVLYKLVVEAFGSRLAANIAAFLAAVSMTIYCWDFMLLTENLSIFLINLTAYYMVLYLKYNNKNTLKALIALLTVSLFTKPFFVALPIFVALILLINYISKHGFSFKFNQHFKTAVLGFAGIYIGLLLYSGVNQLQHSFFGITTVGKVNTFGKILQYGMEDYGTNSNLVGDVKEAFNSVDTQFIVEGKFLEPWHFIGTYGWNRNHYIEIGSFAREIILKNPIEYGIKSLELTGQLLLNSPFKDFIAEASVNKAGHPDKVMLTVKKITNIFDSLYPIVILCILELLFIFIFKRRQLLLKNYLILLSILLMVLYHYIISAFFSYGDYCRLLAPSFPLIYAIIALYVSRVLKLIYRMGLKISFRLQSYIG